MSGTVRNATDQIAAFPYLLGNELGHFSIGAFLVCPYVINLSGFSTLKNLQERVAVIYDIDPVSNLQASPLHWHWLVFEGIGDK